MTELRNLLGLLSPAADGRDWGGSAAPAAGPAAASLRPQHGLGELDTLISRVSDAGLPVDLQVDGAPRPLPQGADVAAYRVVQEGLTNVLRHAGAAAASVRVCWDDLLEITVSDDGRSTGPAGLGALNSPNSPNSPNGATAGVPGRGLLGLRERLALYGGELAAGPRPEGGWRLRAVLPLTGLATAGPPS
jgi:signal transduction histidine kinase